MKKLFISLLVISSMGFTAANSYESVQKNGTGTETKVAQSYGYLEVSSPAANSITISIGN